MRYRALLGLLATLLPLTTSIATAQSSQFLSNVAEQAGPHSGPVGETLAQGVSAGTTIVQYGDRLDDRFRPMDAWSEYDSQGRLVITISREFERSYLIGIYLMLHEQAHHYPEPDPPLPEPPPPPADDTVARRASACQELAAECETIGALLALFSVADTVPCNMVWFVYDRWVALWEACHVSFFLGSPGQHCPDIPAFLDLCD